MLIETGITKDGREYEIRQGLTGSGAATCSIFFGDGQVFRGTDRKPVSVSEARNYVEFCCG